MFLSQPFFERETTMSINSILREIAEMNYRDDRRPAPRKVSVLTTDWAKVEEALQHCEEQFLQCKQRFSNGEGGAYADELKRIRTDILPQLRRHFSSSTVSASFDCEPTDWGSAKLSLDLGAGKVIEIFSQFYDSFTPGMCHGSARGYVAQNATKTDKIVSTLLKVL